MSGMRYTLRLVTAPTGESLSADEAKLYARVEDFAGATPYSDDELIADLITQSREEIEDRGLALSAQTWEMILPRFPITVVLPKNPVRSVVSINYYDSDGTLQLLDEDQYTVDTDDCPARIYPAYGVSWPATRSVHNAVTVQFIAGYASAATPTAIPERLRQFCREYVSHRYWNKELPDRLYRLLDGYAIYR